MNELQQRVLDISKKLKLSHIGSNLSVLPILEEIYAKKKPGDIVILCNAHAHLAHLVVSPRRIRSKGVMDLDIPVEMLIERFGIHCDKRAGCDASGGSLGHAIGIGIGYAIANRNRDVYTVVSDGSLMEGSNWEALRIADNLELDNLIIHCNFNGYSAVNNIDTRELENRMSYYFERGMNIIFHYTKNGEGFEGIQGHYKII